MNKKILISLFSFSMYLCSIAIVEAQVTIGSVEDPVTGALLDLKQNASLSNNSTKGMIHPRVALTDKNDLVPMFIVGGATSTDKATHTGLIVYNTTSDATFSPGLHIWNGMEWQRLTATSIVAPAIGEFQGNAAGMNPVIYDPTAVDEFKGVVTIPYTDGNGGFYTGANFTFPSTNTVNGLTFTPLAGQLAYGAGAVYLKVTGRPTVVKGSPTTVDVTFLGKTTSISVGEDKQYSVIPYVRKSVNIGSAAGVVLGSETSIGNLEVRYIYAGIDGAASYIQFRSKIVTHASFWFEKMGTGNGGKGYLYTFNTLKNLDTNNWYDFAGGSGYSSSTKDLNPTKCDQGRATIVFQNNTNREVYRITCNAYTSIDASVTGAVTFFVEKLE